MHKLRKAVSVNLFLILIFDIELKQEIVRHNPGGTRVNNR